MRHAWQGPWIGAIVASSIAGCGGCKGSTPAEPEDAGGLATIGAPAQPSAGIGLLPRDDAGHLVPRLPEPPLPQDAAAPPPPQREPDWDLDTADPARDYVRRYVAGTQRYGDALGCMTVGASKADGDKRRVEVRVTGAAPCKSTGSVRDAFSVDVARDRLSLGDKSGADPLARWPDGSDPEGPAGGVRSMDDLKSWKSDVRDVLKTKLMLVPIRVQLYGRGTYPVITIAGWHGAVVPTATPDALRDTAAQLCKASGDMPMALFGGLDRSLVLRIRCPGGAKFEKL